MLNRLVSFEPSAVDAAKDTVVDAGKSVVNWFDKIDWTTIGNYGLRVVGALALLLLGFCVAKQAKKIAVKAATKGMRDDGTSPLPGFLGSGVYWMVLLVIVLCCLSIFGVETTSFAAVIGAAGLAIGLAFQGTLSNLAAGVMIIVFKPFKLGDFISGAGQSGTVKALTLFSTTIVTPDNRTITVPNSALSGSTIDNCSTQPTRRADVTVVVPYDSDLDSVREALMRATKVEGALEEPAAQVYLCEIAPGASVTYAIRTWCNSGDYWAVKERVTMQAKRELDRNGATISSKGLRRADVAVGVAYEADLDKTRAALEAALKVEGVLSEPAPAVVLCDLGDSSVNYSVRAWCEGVNYWGVKERLTAQVKRELDKAGIEIPFPQVTVSHK